MGHDDALFTIAELSVALAGFSGVVVGLRGARGGGGVPRQDAFGLVHILSSSGAAMVFSLLPSVLGAAGVGEASAWRGTSIALGVVLAVASALWALAARRTAPRHPLVFWPFVVASGVFGAALLVTAPGWVAIGGTLLPLALLWLLAVAFAQFVTFLALFWAPGE